MLFCNRTTTTINLGTKTAAESNMNLTHLLECNVGEGRTKNRKIFSSFKKAYQAENAYELEILACAAQKFLFNFISE